MKVYTIKITIAEEDNPPINLDQLTDKLIDLFEHESIDFVAVAHEKEDKEKLELHVEINSAFVPANSSFHVGQSLVMITPPLDEDYWMYRVPVSENQAMVAFPKFGVVGIGFQHEDDWNTNLPSTCSASMIYNHIKHNKGNKAISDKICLKAIKLLQKTIEENQNGSK